MATLKANARGTIRALLSKHRRPLEPCAGKPGPSVPPYRKVQAGEKDFEPLFRCAVHATLFCIEK